jgi:hypothetical protein
MTTLSNGTGVTAGAATMTVSAAVLALDHELGHIYDAINTSNKAQAGTATPTDNTTGDLWLDTNTTPAVLKYYNGATWTSLVNPSLYDSGLTLAQSIKGFKMNALLSRSATAKTVQLYATTARPVTVESQGELLQITSTITLDTSALAAGTYYIHPSRTGSTTTFTLAYDASQGSSDNYLGHVVVGTAGVVVSVVSYDSFEHQQVQNMMNVFGVSQTNGTARALSPTKLNYTTTILGTEGSNGFDLANDILTPARKGWYELNVTSYLAGCTTQGLLLYVGSTFVDAVETTTARAMIRAICYFDGSTTTARVDGYANAGATVSQTYAFQNAFWGRWLGESY